MPRIRTVKPEFWADEKLSLLDPLTRLVFLGLICLADDAGRLVDNVELLDGQLFPNTDDTCLKSLETLASISRIIRYRSASGQQLIQIANWAAHQKVDNPSKYTLPAPESAVLVQPAVPSADGAAPVLGDVPSASPVSREPRETLSRVSRSDLLPTTTDLRPSTEQVSAAAHAFSIRANQGLAEHPTKPQSVPRIIATSGASRAAAEAILQAGVPTSFAEPLIYELAKSHTADGEVRSLRYFTNAVVRGWECEQAAAEARESPPPASSNGAQPRRRSPATKTTPQKFAYVETIQEPTWQK